MFVEASEPPTARRRIVVYPLCRELFQRGVLDVVLGGVLVRELVHDVEAVTVCVVDLDERFPLIGKSVLGEDRLDRTLWFTCPAILGGDSAGQRKRVLARNDCAECLLLVRRDLPDVHDAPVRLTRREVEPADRSAADGEVRLAVAFFAGSDGDEAGKRSSLLQPRERLVIGRAQPP